jgi:hypothetical protein
MNCSTRLVTVYTKVVLPPYLDGSENKSYDNGLPFDAGRPKEVDEESDNEIFEKRLPSDVDEDLDKGGGEYLEEDFRSMPNRREIDVIEVNLGTVLVRGRYIYREPRGDCVKNCLLVVAHPISIVFCKCCPLLSYLPLKAASKMCCGKIGCLTDRVSYLEEVLHFDRLPMIALRASIGLVVHPIISFAGCIICCYAGEFARLNGDVERCINGHNDADVRNKSVGRRGHEAFYMAICEQPIGMVKEGKIPEGAERVSLESLEVDGALAKVFHQRPGQESMI